MSKRRRPAEIRLHKRTDEFAVPATAAAHPRSWYRDPQGALHTNLDPKRFAAILAEGTGVLWVDIDVTSPAQHALLHEVFKFHPLSIEDTTSSEGQQPACQMRMNG